MLSCGCQVSSPLVSFVSMWSMLVAFLGHTYLFWALLYLVLLNEINKTESDTFNIKWGLCLEIIRYLSDL